MKKLIAYLAAMLVAGAMCVHAEEDDNLEWIRLYVDNLTTNAGVTATNTYTDPVTAEVLGVYLDVGTTAGATVTVVIATDGTTGKFPIAQTLLAVTNVAADAVYPARDKAVYAGGAGNFASNPVPFYLIGDYPYMTATNGCTNATIDIQAFILIDRK